MCRLMLVFMALRPMDWYGKPPWATVNTVLCFARLGSVRAVESWIRFRFAMLPVL